MNYIDLLMVTRVSPPRGAHVPGVMWITIIEHGQCACVPLLVRNRA